MITHVVFFKLSNRDEAVLAEALNKLVSMKGKIPQIRHLEAGVDIARSERSHDLALLIRFDNIEDLKAYQDHPYHAGEVVPFLKNVTSSIVTVDYES